jgi:hypothetical protein
MDLHNRDEVNIHNEGFRIRTFGTRGIADCPDIRPIRDWLLVWSEVLLSLAAG